MPRENSLSDSEGRSLTPDPGEGEDFAVSASSANYSRRPDPLATHDLARITSIARSMRSKSSKLNPQSPPLVEPVGWASALPPKDRFRAVVRKVMAMHRGTSMLSMGHVGRLGAEPGIDPSRPAVDAMYNHIKEDCEIEIVDYSSVRHTARYMNNAEFVDFMNVESEDMPPKDPWVKVRWINIGGISWDVIKAVSTKYHLHPLALEDVFHGHSRTRSKADYYSRHLFLRVLCHEVTDDDDDEDPDQKSSFTNAPRTTSPEPMEPYSKEVEKPVELDNLPKYGSGRNSGAGTLIQRRGISAPLLPTGHGDLKMASRNGKSISSTGSKLATLMEKESMARVAHRERKIEEVTIDALKKGTRVNVKVSPMFIFLFRDGTIISVRQTPNLSLTAPIAFRLRSRDTVLRKSADPSMLLHALLDLIVDKAIHVVDKYQTNIRKFERETLLVPKMKTVRELHILSGDLILLERTLDPIKTLVYGLRRYDLDRCTALVDSSDPANKDVKVVGFMSHKAKIYLADVVDHMDYILASLEMFAGIAENLINYSFNVASYEMNDVMRRLTVATIVCLPLTFLTGYCGMNFEPFAIKHNSDLYFWEIALPIMVVVTPLALWGDLTKMWHFIQKKSVTRQALMTL